MKLGVGGVEKVAEFRGLRHESVTGVENLADVLADLAREENPLIILNAGDGTVSRTLEICENLPFSGTPVLGLLRGGTTNMIHSDVGFRGRPEEALQELVRCIETGSYSYQSRHMLRVRQASREPSHYGFFFGTHAVVRAILRTRAHFHKQVSTGRLSELLSVTAMIWRLSRGRVHTDPVLSPVSLDLSLDGDTWRGVTHILLLATSLHKVVPGIHPLKKNQQAGFAMLNWPGYRLMPWLWRFVRGNLDELTRIALRGEFRWVLDGEIHEHGPADGVLEVDVASPVRFLVGGSP